MKANEIEDGKVLMIGDFVIGCIETDIVGEATYKIPCKVTDIHHYGDVICEPLKSFPDELDWQEGDDFGWIEAIPLTAEILEKNGFVEQEYGWRKLNAANWCININIFNGKERYALSVLGINTQVTLHGYYVHEPQHAMRLCGIDKEIVL